MVDCQQNVPAPSCVNGAVIVAVTGLHTPVPIVGVIVGVLVRPVVGVRVGVFVMTGVFVRVSWCRIIFNAKIYIKDLM